MAASDTVKPPTVVKVGFTRIQQPQTVDENLIRQCISVKVNDVFNQAKVDVDVQKLLDTGWFRVVRVNQAATNGEIRLNYLLQEKPKITQITFSGNTRFDEKTLTDVVSSKIDLLLDEQVIADDARKIQEFYRKSGCPNTKVRRNMNINESAGEGSVTFEVME
jgi:outer membrane protein insertion porin family